MAGVVDLSAAGNVNVVDFEVVLDPNTEFHSEVINDMAKMKAVEEWRRIEICSAKKHNIPPTHSVRDAQQYCIVRIICIPFDISF